MYGVYRSVFAVSYCDMSVLTNMILVKIVLWTLPLQYTTCYKPAKLLGRPKREDWIRTYTVVLICVYYIYCSEASINDCSTSRLYISSTIFAAPNVFLISSPIMFSLLETPINLPREFICAASVLCLSFCFKPSTHRIKLSWF